MKKGFYIGLTYFFLVLLFGFLNMYRSKILGFDDLYIFKSSILTQGWGFFTKNPKDVKTEAYYKGRNIIIPLTRKENLFGLIRSNSRYSYEVGLMLKNIKDHKWNKTTSDSFNGEYTRTKSTISNPLIVGKIIIVNSERTPWAWASFDGKLDFIKMYVKLDVYE